MNTDVLGYLTGKGMELKRAGGYEVHTACIFCHEEQGKRGRLYINVDPDAEIPGLFHCKICDQRGALVTIKRHFGDETSPREDNTMIRREILKKAAEYYHDRLADNEEVLRWLKQERGLTLETIVKHQIGWADGGLLGVLREEGYKTADIIATGLVSERGERIGDFLRDQVTIPYHVAGSVVLIRGKEIGGKYLTPPGAKTRLFNSDAIWETDEVIITEGEFDALVLEQQGYKAVGAPGANVWQDTWDGYFAHVRRVYIVFDPDETGKRGADKLREKLSPRSRIVSLPVPDGVDPKDVDPTYLLVQRRMPVEEFQGLLDAAGGSLLITVDEAFREHQEIQGLTGIRLGIEHLDLMLTPGLLPSQVMVVLAKTGTGKTIFLLNLFHRMQEVQKELKILFVSLEQTRGEWFERARRIHRFYDHDATDTSTLDLWRERLLIVDKNRLGPDTLVGLLEEYEYEMGSKPDVVAIDYLGYWAQSFKGERYERTSDAIMSLKAIAKEHRVAIIAPHQVSRGTSPGAEPQLDAARDAGVVEETADFLLTLWNTDSQHGKDPAERKGLVKCRIAKSRHGGVGVIEEFRFAPLTLAMVPMGDMLSGRAKAELDHLLGKMTWEESVYQHKLGDPPTARVTI